MSSIETSIPPQVLHLQDSSSTGREFREEVVAALDKLDGYDWSGIYRLEGDTLVLDAYVGAATDHTRIPIGVGVCGSAVAENRNKLIADVRQEANYLACSLTTRSEIVVLIWRGDQILAQIDIDSHQTNRFKEFDEQMLEWLAGLIATRWEVSGP